MKTVRQVAILDIIEKQEIEKQEELASALNARGIRVTQATVSRDIKELRLLKVLTPSGKYKYATGDQADNNLTDRFIRMLAESLLSVSSANNLIVDLRENHNLFCSIVVYPVIPRGEIILRVIPTAAHTLEDVNYTIEAFKSVRDKLESGFYRDKPIPEGFAQEL